jgi:hypothetical protein
MGPDHDGHGFPHGPGWPGWPGGPGGPHGIDPGLWPFLPGLLLAVLLVVAVLAMSGYGLSRLGRARAQALPDPSRARWSDAVARHRGTAQAYTAFECDVHAVMALPGLADVTQPATARFVDAFAEAGALCTDEFPGPAHAERFVVAAEHAQRAWDAAVQAAERVHDAAFAPGERALLDQVRTLLEVVGSSPYEPERRTAFLQVRRRLVELERRTGWRLPRPAAVALESRVRGELVAAG